MEGDFCFSGDHICPRNLRKAKGFLSASSGVAGRGVWVLGELEGASGVCYCGVLLKCSYGDVPKPFLVLVFEGFVNLPRFPNPSLTGLT